MFLSCSVPTWTLRPPGPTLSPSWLSDALGYSVFSGPLTPHSAPLWVFRPSGLHLQSLSGLMDPLVPLSVSLYTHWPFWPHSQPVWACGPSSPGRWPCLGSWTLLFLRNLQHRQTAAGCILCTGFQKLQPPCPDNVSSAASRVLWPARLRAWAYTPQAQPSLSHVTLSLAPSPPAGCSSSNFSS